MKQHFSEKFENTIELDIIDYYQHLKRILSHKMHNLLYKYDDSDVYKLISIVYGNIKKEYTKEVFHEDPELIIPFLKEEPPTIKKPVERAPSKCFKTFDWSKKKNNK